MKNNSSSHCSNYFPDAISEGFLSSSYCRWNAFKILPSGFRRTSAGRPGDVGRTSGRGSPRRLRSIFYSFWQSLRQVNVTYLTNNYQQPAASSQQPVASGQPSLASSQHQAASNPESAASSQQSLASNQQQVASSLQLAATRQLPAASSQ